MNCVIHSPILTVKFPFILSFPTVSFCFELSFVADDSLGEVADKYGEVSDTDPDSLSLIDILVPIDRLFFNVFIRKAG
jgi:hypothetical protein